MTRLNVLLLVALIFSSIYLVRISHESRRLFAELDKARNEERLLDNEFERLKSDKQSQATPLRVAASTIGAKGWIHMRSTRRAPRRCHAPPTSSPARWVQVGYHVRKVIGKGLTVRSAPVTYQHQGRWAHWAKIGPGPLTTMRS